MEQAIRHLITFDHSYIMNYPTVMFSTGPMFLSAQYGLYTTSHPFTPDNPAGHVRILPKSLYGKNAKDDEAPNAFVSHHYGSSWHSDDAAFILFLGRSGIGLMWLGFFVLILGVLRLFLQSNRSNSSNSSGRRHPRGLYKKFDWTQYDLLLPHSNYGSGYHLDMHAGGSSTPTTNTSPLSSPTYTSPPSPTPPSWGRVPLVPFSIEERGASSSLTNLSSLFNSAGAWARARVPADLSSSSAAGTSRSSSPSRMFIGRGGRSRNTFNKLREDPEGLTFLLPAIFAIPPQNTTSSRKATHSLGLRDGDGVPRLRVPTPGRRHADSRTRLERELALEAGGVTSLPPPPYGSTTASRRQQTRSNAHALASSSRLWSANDNDDAWGWPASPDSS